MTKKAVTMEQAPEKVLLETFLAELRKANLDTKKGSDGIDGNLVIANSPRNTALVVKALNQAACEAGYIAMSLLLVAACDLSAAKED